MDLVKEGAVFLNGGECGRMLLVNGEHCRGVYSAFCLLRSSWTSVETKEGSYVYFLAVIHRKLVRNGGR